MSDNKEYDATWWLRLLKAAYIFIYSLFLLLVVWVYFMGSTIPSLHRNLVCDNHKIFNLDLLNLSAAKSVPANISYNFVCNELDPNPPIKINVGASYVDYVSDFFMPRPNYKQGYMDFVFGRMIDNSKLRSEFMNFLDSDSAKNKDYIDWNVAPNDVVNSLSESSYLYALQYNNNVAKEDPDTAREQYLKETKLAFSNSKNYVTLIIDTSTTPDFTITNPVIEWMKWLIGMAITLFILICVMKLIRFVFEYIVFSRKFKPNSFLKSIF